MDFSIKLRRARLLSGMSQKDLAEAAETTPSLISRYESGKSVPRAETIEKLAKILGVPASEALLWAEGSKSSNYLMTVPVLSTFEVGARSSNEPSETYELDTRLLGHARQDASKIIALEIMGEAMEPVLMAGDVAFIDTEDTLLRDGLIYALKIDGLLTIKKVSLLLDRKILLVAVNHNYPNHAIEEALVQVVGRIVGRFTQY